jgi:hypothetical protein
VCSKQRLASARGLLGAVTYVRDDKAAFEGEVARLAINPAFGEVYRVRRSAARHTVSTRPSHATARSHFPSNIRTF